MPKHSATPILQGIVLAGLCGVGASFAGTSHNDRWADREAVIYTPTRMPAFGSRELVVVLHGGLGNAQRIAEQRSESGLNFNALADAGGFVVAYLNGTPVARGLSQQRLGWNAGTCCGVPASTQRDDVAYVQSAVKEIAAHYGVDIQRVFGVGHSNGAMMTQRLMCETGLYVAAVAVSGGLENGAEKCPSARGKNIMGLHGEQDRNVPVEGGRGRGLSRVDFRSESDTARVWKESGANYLLQVIPRAEHAVESLDTEIRAQEGISLAQKVVRFFGLPVGP